MHYLDNAATSFPKPRCTVQAMADALETSGANPGRAGHRLSLAAGRIIEICRQHIAEMLGEVVTDSTKKNLEMRVDAENGATAGMTRSIWRFTARCIRATTWFPH